MFGGAASLQHASFDILNIVNLSIDHSDHIFNVYMIIGENMCSISILMEFLG